MRCLNWDFRDLGVDCDCDPAASQFSVSLGRVASMTVYLRVSVLSRRWAVSSGRGRVGPV